MSGEVNNPVQTADIAEPIVAAGTGVSDFDELERLDDQAKAQKKAEKAEAKAKSGDPKGAKDYDKNAKDPKAAKEKGKEETQDAKPKRTYKIRQGEVETELTPDGLLEVMVDGKPVPVTLQDLINNHAGKQSWDKKFSELDRDRKGFHTERENIAKTIRRFYDHAVTQGDPQGALEIVAEAFGANPLEVRGAYQKRIDEYTASLQGKSPEEIQAMRKDQELETYRQRELRRAEEAEEVKLRSQITERIDKVRESHGLDEGQFRQAFGELKAHGIQDITPETVGQYVGELKARTSIQEAVKQASPDIDEAQLDRAIDDLRKAQISQGLSDQDIAEVALEVYSKPSSAKRLAKKVEAKGPAFRAPMNPAQEPLSFDDV